MEKREKQSNYKSLSMTIKKPMNYLPSKWSNYQAPDYAFKNLFEINTFANIVYSYINIVLINFNDIQFA